MDRKYSDPKIWDNSIDWDDAPDGSDGGYTKNCSYILPAAMRELVRLRAELAGARTVKESLLVALKQYGKHSVEGEPCPVCEAINAAMAGGE